MDALGCVCLLGSALPGSGTGLGSGTHSVNNDRVNEICGLLVLESFKLGLWEGTLYRFGYSLPFSPASSVPGREESVTGAEQWPAAARPWAWCLRTWTVPSHRSPRKYYHPM